MIQMAPGSITMQSCNLVLNSGQLSAGLQQLYAWDVTKDQLHRLPGPDQSREFITEDSLDNLNTHIADTRCP
jgi:hypothetical protein